MATTPLPFPHEALGSVGPAAPLPAGTAVAHLTIERVLHEGLHSIVYLARDPADQALALMEYFPRVLALRQPDGSVRARQAGDAIALSVGREAFVVDANTLERIDHPGIVRVLGSLQAHRTVYRAMRFVDGPTLERHIGAHGGAASAGAVVRLLEQLLDALDVLHHAGVVHGCVRPDQILLAAGERPVLLGMGSAGAEIVGHEAGPWSAPEQAAMSRHDRINSATDLYMAAATAWCYATGEPPPALRERLAQPDAWDPAAALADLPEAPGDAPGTRERLAAALSAALALLPAERPQRVADLRRLLRPALGPSAAAGASAAATAEAEGSEPDGTVPLWVGTMPDRDEQWEVFEKEQAYGRRPQAAPGAPQAADDGVTDLPSWHAVDGPASDAAQSARWRWWWPLPVLALAGLVAAGWSLWREEQSPPVTVSERPVLPAIDAAAADPSASLPAPPTAAPAAAAPSAPADGPAPAPAAAPLPTPAQTVAIPEVAAPPVIAPPATAPPPATKSPATAPPEPPPTVAAPAVGRPPARPPAAVRPRSGAVPASPRTACGNRSQFALLYCLQEQCRKPSWRNHPQCNELRRSGDIQ